MMLFQTRQSFGIKKKEKKKEWQTFIAPPFSVMGIIMEYHLKMSIMDEKRNTDRTTGENEVHKQVEMSLQMNTLFDL